MSLATSTLSADVDAIHSAEIQTAQVSGIESQTAMSAMPTYPQASGITLRMCSQPECTSILAPAYPKRRCPRCRTHAKEVARHHKRSAERMLHMDSGSSPGPSSAASPSKKLRTASNPYPNLTVSLHRLLVLHVDRVRFTGQWTAEGSILPSTTCTYLFSPEAPVNLTFPSPRSS